MLMPQQDHLPIHGIRHQLRDRMGLWNGRAFQLPEPFVQRGTRLIPGLPCQDAIPCPDRCLDKGQIDLRDAYAPGAMHLLQDRSGLHQVLDRKVRPSCHQVEPGAPSERERKDRSGALPTEPSLHADGPAEQRFRLLFVMQFRSHLGLLGKRTGQVLASLAIVPLTGIDVGPQHATRLFRTAGGQGQIGPSFLEAQELGVIGFEYLGTPLFREVQVAGGGGMIARGEIKGGQVRIGPCPVQDRLIPFERILRERDHAIVQSQVLLVPLLAAGEVAGILPQDAQVAHRAGLASDELGLLRIAKQVQRFAVVGLGVTRATEVPIGGTDPIAGLRLVHHGNGTVRIIHLLGRQEMLHGAAVIAQHAVVEPQVLMGLAEPQGRHAISAQGHVQCQRIHPQALGKTADLVIEPAQVAQRVQPMQRITIEAVHLRHHPLGRLHAPVGTVQFPVGPTVRVEVLVDRIGPVGPGRGIQLRVHHANELGMSFAAVEAVDEHMPPVRRRLPLRGAQRRAQQGKQHHGPHGLPSAFRTRLARSASSGSFERSRLSRSEVRPAFTAAMKSIHRALSWNGPGEDARGVKSDSASPALPDSRVAQPMK